MHRCALDRRHEKGPRRPSLNRDSPRHTATNKTLGGVDDVLLGAEATVEEEAFGGLLQARQSVKPGNMRAPVLRLVRKEPDAGSEASEGVLPLLPHDDVGRPRSVREEVSRQRVRASRSATSIRTMPAGRSTRSSRMGGTAVAR
jgi:hypothetical protein